MCDTMVALGNSTADGSVLFAKNSDREPNESQGLVFYPPAIYPAGSSVKCTYAEIPQVRESQGVILSQPFWMYGCEMGANEAGVVMGNEAVFTRVPYEEAGLLGMDLMRLALERGHSAYEALCTIIDLLVRHGQCALGGYKKQLKYHNSFLIADSESAYVLETAGRHWVFEEVGDVRAISNSLSIGEKWADASKDLVNYAIQKGWCRSKSDFHFAKCYRDPFMTFFSASRQRHACVSGKLMAEKGRITLKTMATILRDHGPGAGGPGWTPSQGLFMTVCAHGSWGPIRGGGAQTTASMISQLSGDRTIHWFTGTSAPCTGVFKPVGFVAGDSLTSLFGPMPGPSFDRETRWWRHELLHRSVLLDYVTRLALYAEERDALEVEFFDGASRAFDQAGFMEACFERADAAEREWSELVAAAPLERRPGALYRRFWERNNSEAGLPDIDWRTE